MNKFKHGDIVLVRFPFTDLKSSKLRPALVISSRGEDLIVVGIFSRIPDEIKDTWVVISEEIQDFSKTGLKKTSITKTEKIATIRHTIVSRKLGKLPSNLLDQVNQALKRALELR
ncbi:type II toxin-antitoxin system PemK/MazF family toxin [candidate division KSB1 bacterium]|nr:MAG: type II toxin-antitoxin system PemK/MazF family toxin [candidate division KSB1 bacterium]